ncbi:unnamed protein product [Arabidopsis thaliana]|uniref:Uncharacterized protein n=1 Tax=Arabidopsis thaliana TaxID=3702 RepID=A0A654EGZ1_ARATH|nr:unnamed protein product [Arabidopsis thaliana]
MSNHKMRLATSSRSGSTLTHMSRLGNQEARGQLTKGSECFKGWQSSKGRIYKGSTSLLLLQVKEIEFSVGVILRAWRTDLSKVRTRLSRAPSFEPSRDSSYEPHEASTTKHRKKVKTKRKNAAQAEQSNPERYSAEQLDVPTEYNPPPPNVPAYTQESMDEFARMYFS